MSNGTDLAKKKWKSRDRSVSERSEQASFQKRFVQLRLKFGAKNHSERPYLVNFEVFVVVSCFNGRKPSSFT